MYKIKCKLKKNKMKMKIRMKYNLLKKSSLLRKIKNQKQNKLNKNR